MFLTSNSYSSKEVENLTGLKAYNLRYYAKKGIFPPSLQDSDSPGKYQKHRYSPVDVLVLQAVAELKRKGFSFAKIRKVIEYLRANHNLKKPFHAVFDGRRNVRILTDSKDNFYICYHDHEVVEHLKAGGQYMLLDVSDMASDLKDKIRALQFYKREQDDKKIKAAVKEKKNTAVAS